MAAAWFPAVLASSAVPPAHTRAAAFVPLRVRPSPSPSLSPSPSTASSPSPSPSPASGTDAANAAWDARERASVSSATGYQAVVSAPEVAEGTEGEAAATVGEDTEGGVDDDAVDGAWSACARAVRVGARAPWTAATRLAGASILPLMTDPQHDRVFFLLGRERKVLAWGAGSSRWSDFGGGCARSDMDAADTAAREFLQETAGCVPLQAALPPGGGGARPCAAALAGALRSEDYLLRVETCLPPCATAPFPRLFVTFVVQVPWDPRALMRFAHCRALLSGLAKRLAHVPLEPAEEAALTPPDAALRVARERWLLAHPAVRKRVRTLPTALVAAVSGGGGGGSAPDADAAGGGTGGGASGGTRITVVESVNADYLEKDALDLWSVPSLRRALAFGGMLANRDGVVESLRPAFAPVLAAVLDELATHFPLHFMAEAAQPCVYAPVSFSARP